MSNSVSEDNMIENEDLLAILGADVAVAEEVSKDVTADKTEEEEADDKLNTIKSIATSLSQSASLENLGSGDIDTDIANWFSGKDRVPSNPLKEYTTNSEVKMDYALSRNTLKNYDLMSDLREFFKVAFPLLLDENALLTLSPNELEDRTRTVFAMYKELYNMNAKTLVAMKDYRLKTNGTDDKDTNLMMLLQSIPQEKIKAILQDLNK